MRSIASIRRPFEISWFLTAGLRVRVEEWRYQCSISIRRWFLSLSSPTKSPILFQKWSENREYCSWSNWWRVAYSTSCWASFCSTATCPRFQNSSWPFLGSSLLSQRSRLERSCWDRSYRVEMLAIGWKRQPDSNHRCYHRWSLARHLNKCLRNAVTYQLTDRLRTCCGVTCSRKFNIDQLLIHLRIVFVEMSSDGHRQRLIHVAFKFDYRACFREQSAILTM